MKGTLRLLIVGLIALSFIGCGSTALELRDANNRLLDLYRSKQDFAKGVGEPLLVQSVNEDLDALAEKTAALADAETSIDNQIAFYRVAVTAAWQSGNKNVESYGNRGEKACQGENFSKAPRDCAMLMTFAYFAGVDQTTREVESINADSQKTKEEKVNLLAGQFDKYNVRFKNLMEKWGSIKGKVGPDFIDVFRMRIITVVCTLMNDKTIGKIVKLNVPEGYAKADELTPKMNEAIQKLKDDLGVTSYEASCVNELP